MGHPESACSYGTGLLSYDLLRPPSFLWEQGVASSNLAVPINTPRAGGIHIAGRPKQGARPTLGRARPVRETRSRASTRPCSAPAVQRAATPKVRSDAGGARTSTLRLTSQP